MFSRSKKANNNLDIRQRELFEHAQEHIKEKKGLYTHFIFFIVGCLFMVIVNLLLDFGRGFQPFGQHWFVYGILIWFFFMLVHTVRVLLFSKFMGKAWQAQQMNYLVSKQNEKIQEMEQKLNLEIPKEAKSAKTILLDNTQEPQTDTEF